MIPWACPHCGAPLELEERLWRCPNNHCFDCAKEGYVNLLPPNRRRSKEPGDNPEMVAARRRIHEANLYHPLAIELAQVIASCGRIKYLLDIGCGEGFYTGIFANQLPNVTMAGIDIAKSAVRLAARKYPTHHYAVASSTQLPVLGESIDLVTQIFAPNSDLEVLRVLKDEGYYLQVGPAPMHLWQIREALYDQPQAHEHLRVSMKGADLIQQGELNYHQTLDNAQLRDLLMATPFAFRGHREKRAALQKQLGITVTLAFEWRLFQKLR